MGKRRRLKTVTVLCIFVARLSATAAGEEPVFFADENLKRWVENRLNVSDPTPTDMLGLIDFTRIYGGLTDLTGLEYATNLQMLSLGLNQISDLSPLSGLANLQMLHLSDNEVRDLSPLSGLMNLRDLDFHNNRVSDLSPLAGLTKLQWLVLYNNQVSDLSPLLGLTDLRMLELRANPLNDEAYCRHLRMIKDNNHRIVLIYSPNRRPPAGITASNGTLPDRVRLTWEAVCSGPLYGHLRFYQVSRALSVDDPPGPISDWQSSLSFDDVTAEPGMKYTYWVRTATSNQGDAAGDYSEPEVGWAPGPPALTISSGPGGAVMIPGEAAYVVEVGQTIAIRAEPVDANLYVFAGWTGTAVATRLVADANSASTTITVDNARSTLKANFLSRLDRLYVDDDAPNDPGPCTPMIGDPQENGTAEHPFDTIQEGIDVAPGGATVAVGAGVYRECIEFRGRNITVTRLGSSESLAAEPFPVLDANYTSTPVTFKRGEDSTCVLAGFVITRGKGDIAGGVRCLDSSPMVANCLIVGNQAITPDGGIVHCTGSEAVFANCTVADNVAGVQGTAISMLNSDITLVNSIVWGNIPGNSFAGDRSEGGSKPRMTYTDMAKIWSDRGNIEVDPLFARPGRWADRNNPNQAVEPGTAGAIWTTGDYHLKSQAGRWDPTSEDWVLDEVTSPCIDAGDPNNPVADEPEPNGGIVNMGAYGGTAEASKSYFSKP